MNTWFQRFRSPVLVFLHDLLMIPVAWGLTYWADGYDALKNYAHSYAFLAYLARNVSPLIVREIVSGAGQDYAGLDAVDLALTALGETTDAVTSIKRWREATIHDDPDTQWLGYMAASDGIYSLGPLVLLDILASSPNYTETRPNFDAFPIQSQMLTVDTGHATRILAGKVIDDGDVILNIKNDTGVSHLEYKVIRK